jgi:hypothetical protein
MGTTIQARLDEETQAALERLVRDNGWTASQAIRACIREAAGRRAPKPRPRLIGVGMFDSGIHDLATNKKHMRNFGVKSMGKGWRPPKESAK